MRKGNLKIIISVCFALVLFGFLGRRPCAEDYKLSPGDVLKIEIWDEPDLSGDFKVGSDGKLVINWLDPIKVDGLTLMEARKKILSVLKKKYIKNPIINTITLKGEEEGEPISKGITVVGAVEKEGVYKYKEGYTVLGAILDAGGFTKFAAKNRTYLVRGRGKNRKKYKLRMGDVVDKGDKKKDMLLKPGDMIIVREGIL